MSFPGLTQLSESFQKEGTKHVFLLNWESWAKSVGAKSGVFVFQSEEEDALEEVLSFGYEEEGFFYSFLARGESGWNQISQGTKPLSLSGKTVELFGGEGSSAYCIGLREKDKFVGFLLMEVEGPPNPVFEIFLRYLVSPLENLSSNFEDSSPNPSPKPVAHNRSIGIEILLQNHPPLAERIQILAQESIGFVLGPEGSGKKTLARWLHQRNEKKGEFLCINSLPEQVTKLEKSFLHWKEMAKGGTLVLERISQLNQGQQRYLYEEIQSWNRDDGLLFFLDRNEKKKEVYPPFWDTLTKKIWVMPPVSSLPNELRKNITQSIWEEIQGPKSTATAHLGNSAWEVLLSLPLPGNWEELRQILEMASWRSSGEIKPDDLQVDPGFGIGIPNSEDLDLRRAVDALERQKILLASKLFSGNQVRMAKALGISRGSLQYKIKHLGISD